MSLPGPCLVKAPRRGPGTLHDIGVHSAADSGKDGTDLSAAVSAAQDGDEGAFRVLYRAIQPGLLRYLWVQVGDAAEDVASEAWLQIARDLRTFRGDAAGFRGWAATIARHRALDYARHQRRQPLPGGPVEELAGLLPAGEDTAGSAIDAMATGAALALIAKLPRDQAEAVLLRVVMGLDAKTAAKVLGKRAGAVRTAAYRGLRALAVHLEEAVSDGVAAAAEKRAATTGVTQTPAPALNDMR
jgi:RNA polymerase sigma-70 factor (ECF subfamily)